MSIQFCVSEKEAQTTKLCCVNGPQSSCTAFCAGSACMAWRWVETHIDDGGGRGELVPSTDTHGYCGLAGPPWRPA